MRRKAVFIAFAVLLLSGILYAQTFISGYMSRSGKEKAVAYRAFGGPAEIASFMVLDNDNAPITRYGENLKCYI